MKTLIALFLLTFLCSTATAQLVPVELISIQNDVHDGLTFVQFDDPTMNNQGTVAFVGTSTDALNDFIFVHDSIFFKASDSLPVIFDNIDDQCGIDEFGNVVFMAEANGILGLYKSDIGLLMAEGDDAPGFSAPAKVMFLYRASMSPDGYSFVTASIDVDNNGSADQRVLYQFTPGGIVTILNSSLFLVSGNALNGAFGLDIDYDLDDTHLQLITVVALNTGSTLNDGGVSLNGSLLLQENNPISASENYDNFDFVRVNTNGDYIVSGDSDGATTSDEYLIVNGTIEVKEGDVLDGISLASTATVNAVDINDNGDVVHIWGTAGAQEYLFHGNINDPNGLQDSRMIIKRYDTLDIDNDFIGDYVITDFNAFTSYRGFELKDTNILYINVDLNDVNGVPQGEAIIKLDPYCRSLRYLAYESPCFNETLTIGGNSVTQSGTYYDTVPNATCFDVHRYDVTFQPEPAMGHETAVICAGDSIYLVNGYFSAPGSYYPVISSVTGCDSTVEVQIANLPTYEFQLNYELCQGDSILAGGAYQTTNGIYFDTLTSQYFCDSIIQRNVFFVNEYITNISYTLCDGDSIYLEGAYHYTSGVYYDTLTAQFGCDSILAQSVIFNALPSVIIDSYPVDSICADGIPISLPNALPAGGIYSGNGVDGTNFDPALTGLLGQSFVYYTYTDANGCVGSDNTSIIVYDCYLELNELENRMTIFPNPSSGIFNVHFELPVQSEYSVYNELGQVVLNGTINGDMMVLNLSDYSNGYYYLEIGTERFKLLLHE